MVDLIQDAFDVADIYRNPIMVMGDGMLGQMMEPVEFKEREAKVLPKKTWAATGLNGRSEHNVINSLFLAPEECENHNIHLQAKYKEMEKEARYELYNCDDNCDLIMVAYGTTARICKNVIKMSEKEGIKLGLIRPITLWPFPKDAFEKVMDNTKHGFLSVEMSMGQMVEDVALVVKGRNEVQHFGRAGGMVPSPKEILDKAKEMIAGGVK
jgi:2-oxoglutarate ferredoxin oxidoreductase subunit alpha